MSGVDTRYVNRDSLFLMADIRLDGDPALHRVRVRNLSAQGMMAETEMRLVTGTKLTVELKNVPPVEGTVAWVHGQRFGIAFADEIDPKAARSPVGKDDFATPRFVRPSSIAPVGARTDPKRLRNI